MDEQTREKINDLVAEFQSARTPADRQRVTLRAQRELMFVKGALREFVDRASAIGDVRLIPQDLLGSYEEQQEQRAGSQADADALVDDLIARYEQAGSVRERNEVLLDASEQLAGFPVQSRRFNAAVGAMPGFETEPTTLVPSSSTTTTVPAPSTTMPTGPTTGTTTAPSTTTPTPTPPAGTSPGPVTGTTGVPSATTMPSPAAAPTTTVPSAPVAPGTPTAAGTGTGFGVPQTGNIQSVVIQAQLYAAMVSRGIPEGPARKLSAQYVTDGRTLAEFYSNFDGLTQQGYSRQSVIDSFVANSENAEYFPPPQNVPTYASPRLVSIDGRPPEMSTVPGIADPNNGYELLRNADGTLFFYDPDNARAFLEELSVEQRNQLTTWFLDRGFIQSPLDAVGLVEQTRALLQMANDEGRELMWVQDSMDKLVGFTPDMQYNRLVGPVVRQDRGELMRQVNEIAAAQLGRALTRAERMTLADSVYAKQLVVQQQSAEAQRRSLYGESAVVDQLPSLEEMTTQYLEKYKPQELRQAQQYSIASYVRERALDGAYGEAE